MRSARSSCSTPGLRARHDQRALAQRQQLAHGVVAAHGDRHVGGGHQRHHVVAEVLHAHPRQRGGGGMHGGAARRRPSPGRRRCACAGTAASGSDARARSAVSISSVAVFAAAGRDQHQRLVAGDAQLLAHGLRAIAGRARGRCSRRSAPWPRRRAGSRTPPQVEDLRAADHQHLVVVGGDGLEVAVLAPDAAGGLGAVEDVAQQQHQLRPGLRRGAATRAHRRVRLRRRRASCRPGSGRARSRRSPSGSGWRAAAPCRSSDKGRLRAP